MNVIEIVKQGLLHAGVGWILWLLALLSVASLGIALERWWYLRKRHADLRILAAQLDRDLAAGDLNVAIANLRDRGVAAEIAVAGLRLAHLGPVAAEKAMNSAMALQRSQLERGLAYLATLGNNAPFIGLFGTVVGVIEAFEELGHSSPGHGGAGQAASQAVMSSIAEALVTTAVGIAVALPAVVLFNWFSRTIAQMLQGSEALSQLVLAYLSAKPPDAKDA